ncbi:MAG: hypothetical protein QOK10_3029 [Pseudonocardiales bacterium]|jgi:uncharacterized protein (DUF952 family)|nr:hypothetical protein [Pseudonocardiales bacterium]
MEPIYHLVAESEWRAACQTGRYAPESLASEGFVHFSFAHQVAGTANHLYRDRADLIVVEVDPARLDGPVVVEDLYGMDEEFPHYYGAVPTPAAVAEHALLRDADGDLSFLPAP